MYIEIDMLGHVSVDAICRLTQDYRRFTSMSPACMTEEGD